MGKFNTIKAKNSSIRQVVFPRNGYGEKKLIVLRRKVNELYFQNGLTKNRIVQKHGVSKQFVITWTQSPTQDFSQDRRGWPHGKRRKWGVEDGERIRTIYGELQQNPLEFYCGATVIAQIWRKRYPELPVPPLRTIGQMLSEFGLSEKRKQGRNRGAAHYLCYPEYTIYSLFGGRVLEADFLGEKYLSGRTEPLNFIAFSFKKEPKLRYFQRVSGQTTAEFITHCQAFFQHVEKPDFIKVDNGLAVIGSASGKRNISKAMQFLLANQVIPIFAVPRKPFSQASIEGNNSVFARKFWNRRVFKSVSEVEEQLAWFNLASQRYTGYEQPNGKPKRKKNFMPKVYFIRQVREEPAETGEAGKAFVDILNEKVFLPPSYLNYFILAEWKLPEEKLYLWFEKEQTQNMINQVTFPINPRSKISFR